MTHHVPISRRRRPPPRRIDQPHRRSIWTKLREEEKAQLLRVLNRMLTDRLAKEEATGEEGDHEVL